MMMMLMQVSAMMGVGEASGDEATAKLESALPTITKVRQQFENAVPFPSSLTLPVIWEERAELGPRSRRPSCASASPNSSPSTRRSV